VSTVELVRVGEVLTLRRREIAIDPMEQYRLIGIYSFGKGIFHREPKVGSELGAYRFFAIEPGDLVLSNIQAWEGAIGHATEVDAGTIGTHRFLTYTPALERIDTNWARWFFLSEPGMALIRGAAPGSTMRNRTLSITRFEALDIPLPPIEEQRRIAGRLDQIQARAADLERCSARASGLIVALGVSISARPDLSKPARAELGWRKTHLGSVMCAAKDRIEVEPAGSYPNLGIFSFGRGLFAKPNIEGGATSAKTLNRVHTGQFIYSRLFAFEGSYGFVPPEFDQYFVSNEYPTFDTDAERLSARWLANYLRSPDRWAELASSSKGLGVRRQRVPVESVLAHEVRLPPIEQQRAMVQVIDRLEQARASRAQADAWIGSLARAALNETFAGIADP
jgi:type I restriction enzyme S subunit